MTDRADDIEVSVELASRMQACIDKDKEHTGHIYDALVALLPTVAVQCEMTREAFLKDMGNAYDKRAGWVKDRVVRGKLYLWAPERGARDQFGNALEFQTAS